MSRHAETLRQQLAGGLRTARQLVEITGLSQPTVSRALAALGDEVLRLGAGPAIHYALRDSARSQLAVPVYRVSDAGQIVELGRLLPVRPDGFVMQQTDGVWLHSSGLPWWLEDMRPQGYLGRAYAAAHAASLGLPANPEHWGDADILRALLTHGHDIIGNLLIGDAARQHFLSMPQPQPVERATHYPALALAASAGELPGSSAGGEQPKFCAYTEHGHVLVKFTAAEDNVVSQRWRDLLLAEHLALAVLGVSTGLWDFGSQRFLEVPRFDRIGPLGRVAVFSLRALDAEFVGAAHAPWPVVVQRLIAAGHVTPQSQAGAALLWAFGTLIGNTDMHSGNLSFTSLHGRPYQLAPAYDMLPMAFAPRGGGALADTLPEANLRAEVPADIWRQALTLAQDFHARLRAHDGFSARFAPCIAALGAHIDTAAARISRLG
ncbi:type II toxin-antitoxin system HipA family toxin YjjJ [Aquitalea sp. USM4]|uniref:type II toxin-antitoxin system HipA family toxin YjjJ n=1 Tax=Aquitalea sp. USM4 TaxID=1590041 RepID=UPI001040D721|nr:type II toxin-antitoxin system HipA family toxin YjjJ [Aquitalea sp. USM4]QBJ79591.1 type II toxin-antitoxin system HipA family toxinoxin YjjJ [Aquitalea sp. USM4]